MWRYEIFGVQNIETHLVRKNNIFKKLAKFNHGKISIHTLESNFS